MTKSLALLRLIATTLLCLNLFACTDSSNNDNNNASPVIITTASASIEENNTTVITINATDTDDDIITYSLTDGSDRALFTINSSSGTLSFVSAPDYESPGDSDSNNSYLVQVAASDGDATASQLITITVTNQNDNVPVFTSAATLSIEENNNAVLTVNATDADDDTIAYSLTGGPDQALFNINRSSGALSFVSAPDFESPSDSDNNNSYLVQVSASDDIYTVDQLISITVADVDEAQFGLTSRPSNTTCIIPDPPNTSSEIKLTQVFTGVTFNRPVILRQSPIIDDRWYVAEKSGLIKTFLANDNFTTNYIDLTALVSEAGEEMGLLGMDFHPDFATNNYVYIYYSTAGGSMNHQSVISRFTATNATTLAPSSELVILRIDQPYANHNGGNILFGPDGYLYIGMGDGGDAGDPGDRSQDISSLLGKMLRIDVDNPANGNNYSSPADNPFVGTTGLDEIYALGLRNPWRWSFDRLTGNLILGDVGQGNWEEIDIITNGGNYGWRCYEGNHAYNTSGCLPQSNYIAPIHEYDHSSGFSISGGYVYRGSAIPALNGTYIYTDFGSGPIWGLSDITGTPENTVLANLNDNISSFAEDNDGDIYLLGIYSGLIYRIDPATSNSNGSTFPTLLSQTGCIDTDIPLHMAPGLIPYEINAPFWSDGAIKDRWMAIPDTSTITIELNDDWTYPVNSVLVKNFNLNGKRIETRLLVRHANGDWGGYSYEWNDSETDANLILDGKTTVKGGQTYIYPSSIQCLRCHTPVAGFTLGPETQQLNRDTIYPSTGLSANQLATLDHIGMFSNTLADTPANLPRLTNPSDLTAPIHDRARAYLHTNCAQCHQQGGPTNASMRLHINTLDEEMNICNATPTHQISGATAIMAPGNAANSTMYLRMNCRDGEPNCSPSDEMPPLGSTLVDADGAFILYSWIDSLPGCP